jgi:pimeloyl-ACP methyl ester carboxylesterase
MRDVLVKVVNESYEVELGRLDTPVTLVWGSEDQEVPVAVAERALSVILEGGGEGALEIVPDVGHFLPTEAPETLKRMVERALDQ